MTAVLRRAFRAVVWAVLANLLVWWGGVSTLDIPSDFPPLAGSGPTIFFTTVGAVGAVAVHATLRRLARRPDTLFRRVAVVVLVLSFLPDLWLLTDGARESVPGVTVSGVALLMLMHVVAAAVIVWVLTGGGMEREGETPA